MTNRERALAVLRYQQYDRLPVLHFGFWDETLRKWHLEGHLEAEDLLGAGDGSPAERRIEVRLGFDCNWFVTWAPRNTWTSLFEERVLEELPDGYQKVQDANGAIVIRKPGVSSIPSEVDHLLKGRAEWESLYRPRLQWSADRVDRSTVPAEAFDPDRARPFGLMCGSLFGKIRDWIGVVNLSYLQVDDPPLFDEIIDTVGELCLRCAEGALALGARYDFAHFWEDICFKTGPLVNPAVFSAKVGPWYRRITDLTRAAGLDLCSLDCDGKIDELIPTWLENGVNTMFPIEVGTWSASIAPWRKRYGREIRGVGGMDKRVFARGRAAVDREIERLRPLVGLGGFIPCPDHRIPPDAEWDTVRYYCERMRQVF
jgi:uroporphyrinogen decarboxylase